MVSAFLENQSQKNGTDDFIIFALDVRSAREE